MTSTPPRTSTPQRPGEGPVSDEPVGEGRVPEEQVPAAEAPAPDDKEEEGELTPERALQRTVEEGEHRMERPLVPMLATGIVGGIDVGVGVLGFLLVEQATGSKMLGALAFAIGFLFLLLASSELVTENFLVPIVALIARRSRPRELARLWGISAAGNLIGGWVLSLIVIAAFPDLHGEALKAGTKYADFGFGWRSFTLGLLGGLVITLMTWMQHSTDVLGGKVLAALAAGFLLSAGTLNHAIVASLFMFSALQTQHATFGYLHWLAQFGFAVVANLVGGVGMVTLLRVLQVPDRLATERHLSESGSEGD